jgi:hypothetical protein
MTYFESMVRLRDDEEEEKDEEEEEYRESDV